MKATALGVFVCMAASPVAAEAETFIDVFAGRAMPEDTPLTLRADEARVNGQIVRADLRVDVARIEPTNEAAFGARIGHWFGRTFGVAVDVSTLDPDVKAQTVRATANLAFDESVFGEQVTIAPGNSVDVDIPRITIPTTATIAALAMVRLPVGATADRPAGRFAPYAFAGPVWLITDPSLDGNLGLRAGGGVKLAVTRGLSVFGEYRYTRVNADAIAGRIGGRTETVRASTGDIRADLNIRNHAAVGGVSLSF